MQYHPHIKESARILQNDLTIRPLVMREKNRGLMPGSFQPNELERADLVICNSSFTASTRQLLGVEASG